MQTIHPLVSAKVKNQRLLVVALLTISSFCFGQQQKDSLFVIWNNAKLSKIVRANSFNTYITTNYLETKTDSAYILAKQLEQFTLDNDLKLAYANVLSTLGNVHYIIGNNTLATAHYQKSLKLFKTLNDRKGEATALNNIGRMYKLSWQFDEALVYYNESLAMSEVLKDTTSMAECLINIGNVYNYRYKVDEALDYYLKSLALSTKINDEKNLALNYINLGHNYTLRKDYDQALLYLNKSVALSRKLNNAFLEASGLKNIAQCYFMQKNYDKVIAYSQKSLILAEQISNKPFQRDCYYFLYEGYRAKGSFKKAIDAMEKLHTLEDAAQEIKTEKLLQNITISKIKLKDSLIQVQKNYERSLKHDLKIQQKNKEKSNMALGFGGALLLVVTAGFLGYKSVKRKQLISQQKNEITLQKKDKRLKDLELKSIDAMILGQEKERLRLASDLHDSVGASLSAAKLQFNYFMNNQRNPNQEPEIIKNISTLLEDAYVEVRSMAHLKNCGVIAKNGLLPAVEKLSRSASGNDSFQIEVNSHGLDQRLENSLEISIFRIIQELVTNIIKHAEASEAAINITNHDDSLNIMVEDNGKGFKQNLTLETNKGMGISSIDKRVEHLNGTMIIESEINKGTTVIIDIPL